MMRKETRRLLLGILIIFVLAGIYMFLQSPGKEKGSSSSQESEASGQYKTVFLWDEGADKISEISVENKKDSIVFTLDKEEKLLMQGYESAPPNELAFARLALLLKPEAFDLEITSSDEKKLLEYGLADPEARVSVKFDGGQEKTFLLGKAQIEGTLQYLKLEGEDEIYAVEPGNYNLFTMEKEHFISKSVAPFSIDPSEIELQSISYENKGESFQIAKNADFGNDFSLSLGYAITEPFLYGLDFYKTSQMLEQAKLLQGSIFLLSPSEEERLKYGFEAPRHSMEVEYLDSISGEQGAYKIFLGNETGNEKYREYYVMREGVDVIYTVLGDAVKWKDYTAKELVSKQIYTGKPQEIKEIGFVIGKDEKEYEFLYEVSSKIWTEKTSGKTVDEKAMDYLITLLGQANASETIEKKGVQAQQELAVTIISQSEEKQRVSEKIMLYHYKGYEAFAELPNHPFGDERYFVIPYEVVINILQTLDEL